MERIVASIIRNDRGAAVHNLQAAVLLLLPANTSLSDDANRQALIDKITAEQRNDFYGDATTEGVARFQRAQRTAFDLPLDTGEQVDEPTAAAMNRMLQQLGLFAPERADAFLITGRVEFEDGSPGNGLRVDVFDRDVGRQRVLLGDTERPVLTADDGAFPAIRYRAREFAGGEGEAGPNADLVFEVTAGQDQSAHEITAIYRRFSAADETSESQVADLVLGFEASEIEDVRIVLSGRPGEHGLPEYKRLMLALEPMLLEGATPADFDQERFRDIDFAARETEWDGALIETMAIAWRLARGASREPQLLAETMYGLVRHGDPSEVAPLDSTLSELLDQDALWRAKLEDSIAHRVIDGDVAQHLGRLRDLGTDAATLAGDGRRGTVGDVLAGAGIPESDRRTLIDAYQAHDGSIEEFWRDVVGQRLGWGAAKIREALTALQLADILAYDVPLIARVREQGITAPRDLVALDRAAWTDLVKRVGPSPDARGSTPGEQITSTVNAIASAVDAMYPTESVARLALTSHDPALSSARDLLSRFFEREAATESGEGFDIRTMPVTSYLETHGDRIFGTLAAADKALLTSQLQRLQRVFRLGTDRVQTEALLDLGLDSAFHIARFSPEQFAFEFGERLGGTAKASLVYGRAEQIAGTVLYMYTDLWQGIHDIKPMAIMSSSEPDKIPALKELPAYRALFGNIQLCDCGHCQSFYSPAAYFVDLLHMLDRPSLGAAANPVEVLFRRRPDLGHIQLTCENTNTLIPYVDLVTEVLESFVANGAPTPFNVPPGKPNQRLPQPSAEELRVNPVYLTAASATFADQAYATLQEATFPLALPLNLQLETTRTYLDKLGVSRAELMTLLDGDDGLEALMARAAEILLLSPEEFEVATASKFGGVASLRPLTLAELFGLTIAPTPTMAFNHAAPELVVNAAKPDPRQALIRSLQNILSILSAAPIPISGVYDKPTEAAVNAFLTKKGLSQNGRTDAAFWGALEADAMPSVSVMVCPVPMLLDRSGLTYEELIGLVKTRFVNPTLQGEGDLDYLARLGIPASDIRAWIEAGLPAIPAPINAAVVAAGEDPGFFITWVTRRTRAIVINVAASSPCDLDRATLMHLDGTLVTPDELVAIFRFVRLWRKLGWTLEEADHVIEPGALDKATIFGTILLLANAKQLRDRLDAPIADLVSLWQPIPTQGSPALYDRLFRNRAAQLIDPILGLNRDRTELEAAEGATPPALSDHTGPVIAAFRMSAQDLAFVRSALGLDDDPTLPPAARPLLDITTLSAIYRPVSLARAFGLSVRDLLALTELSGLAVFQRPNLAPRGDALVFADMVGKVRASGAKVGVIEYLCRAVPLPPALSGTNRSAWSRTIAEIIDGLHAIANEEPIEDDPDGEELIARLTALVGADEARATVALIYGRDVYKATLAGLPSPFAFPAPVAARVSYDAAQKELRIRGAMTSTDRILLLAAAGVPAAIKLAYDRAIKALDTQARGFVAGALSPLFTPAEAEATLIDVSSLDAAGVPITAIVDKKITDILARRRDVLGRSLVKQTLTTATGLNADVVGLLLENASALRSMAGVGPAMEDYQTLDGDGLDAEYFANPDLKIPLVVQRTDAVVGFDLNGAVPAPGVPAVNFSVRWTGQLYVPAAGEVTFHARNSDGVRLWVNGALTLDEWRDQPETAFTATLRLDGGQFYPIIAEYYNKTGDALLELSWSSPAIPASVIPQASLYTSATFESLLQRVERIYKVALLLEPFTLAADDLRRLAEHGDVALDLMPLAGPAPLVSAQAMFAQWLALYDFSALRDRYLPTDVTVMDLTSAPTRVEAVARFATLTGVAADTLDAILDAFTVRAFDAVAKTWSTVEPNLTTLASWDRIARALALVEQTGAAPEQLQGWAKVREITETLTGPETLWFTWTAVDEAATDRRADNARRAQEAKNVVRARYDEDRWRAQAQSLNDLLRTRRRSALTAYVLAMPEMMRARVSDSGRLFEFLLIDVEMDPCMETSRIKQGISSVQLFVQRALLNLESEVPPARVDSGRWKWMKVYRAWEANRKVFLYAENYVEMELRDDKTPIFKELESELLQDDLTDANAERTFRHYLEKLDGIAKLIVCGTCIDSEADLLHVFARTATAPFVFYHRWLDGKHGPSWPEGTWSPWQKLPVDVASTVDGSHSGAHLMPVAWNRRLYLFWPLFEESSDDRNADLPDGFDGINCWHIKLAWSEYKDGRWSPKQTGVPVLVSPSQLTHTQDITRVPKHYEVNKVHHEAVRIIGKLFGIVVYDKTIPAHDDPLPGPITGNPLLDGVILKNATETAHHVRITETTTVMSMLPRPADHYLEAKITADELTIGVFCRWLGVAAGKVRTVIEDQVVVIRDGQRADRKERTQTDEPAARTVDKGYSSLGAFVFPACSTEVLGFANLQDLNYEGFSRPKATANSFMGESCDLRPISGVTFALQLPPMTAPLLKAVPTPFAVIDSDNRGGFDRSSPFFYQDQQRCYLVTRETYAKIFDVPNAFTVKPDKRAGMVERALGVATVTDKQMGIAPGAILRTNPWAAAALDDWSVGPGMRAALRVDPAPALPTLSGSFEDKFGSLKDSVKNPTDHRAVALQPEYTFTPHWHPYTCPFIATLNSGGLPAFFTLANESRTDLKIIFGGVIGGPMPIFVTDNFETIYKPDPAQVVRPYPLETVDFSRTGSYSQYNWEAFFHAPMTVAVAHSRAGQYEDALRWFHFVFDPMTADADPAAKRVWRFLPFRDADTSRIEDTLGLLTYTGSDPAKLKQRANLQASIQEWLDNPFNPHIIARRRPVVYMKYVFMKYLDNLIAWADELFQRDTMESINEATQLYVLAANMLGPVRQRTPMPGPVAPETYQTLRGKLDALSNAQVDLETRLPFTQLFSASTGVVGQLSALPQTLYFCLPQNDHLLSYWDTIADRLFKIRHCMSLDGTVRHLPLFEAAINPMLFVEAVAQGLDIGSVLNDLYAPLPRYRFTFMLQQALAMCNEVRSLGGTLLSVLEKRDAESLSTLRAGQETQLLDQVKASKKLQIDEAEELRKALENTAHVTTARIEYYEGLIAQGLISEETDQLAHLDLSNQRQETASWIEATAQQLSLLPSLTTGSEQMATFGGPQLGGAVSAVGRSYTYLAASHGYKAGRAYITGGHARRAEEWRFQRDQAKRELSQVERQLAAARIRREFTQAELRNHETQLDHSRAIEDLLRTKFTNDGLYGWMEGQLRAGYFQCYKAAYEIAKRAERCWAYERGSDASFIKYGAWDSSVRGLLAGERLYLQLKQMERAYQEQQLREFEISKDVSVAQLDPLALIALKETGMCEIEVPEWLFDIDYAGHYFRRLKTVSISIPAVVGRATSLSATLTLLRSTMRGSSRIVGSYGAHENYRADHLSVEAIAASTAQNDSGRFQLDFRDEKYLPFEGAGAIARWRIELPRKFRSFDYDTISDVVLHLKYTARRDETLAEPAQKALQAELDSAGNGALFHLFSLRHDFPNEWQTLHAGSTHTATITIGKDRFPILVQPGAITVSELHAAVILKEARPAMMYKATITPGAGAPVAVQWSGGPGRYRSDSKTVAIPVTALPADSAWPVQLTAPTLPAELANVRDILIAVRYSVKI
jgi:peptidoglycan hydrolase-like protein with peptidoglycan-binding domain